MKKNRVECAKILIEAGASVNLPDFYEVRPIHYAASTVPFHFFL